MANRGTRKANAQRRAKSGTSKKWVADSRDREWFDDPAIIYDRLAARRVYYQTAVVGIPDEIQRIGRTLDRSNVLEIGPGHFPFSATLDSLKVTFLDISKGILQRNQEELRRLHEDPRFRNATTANVGFVHADARKGLPQELAGQHFSALVMNEVLTHVHPKERKAFLEEWARHTDSFMIVDRHPTTTAKAKKRPDFVSGHEIKDELERLGFRVTHFDIKLVQLKGKKTPGGRDWYFILTAKKQH